LSFNFWLGWGLCHPTADAKTWDVIFSAHPCWHFDKIKGKLFPFCDLAQEFFPGAVATDNFSLLLFGDNLIG
jgi:hypothetical protein